MVNLIIIFLGGIFMEYKTSEAQRKASRKFKDNNDRFDIILPSGTRERIEILGFKPSAFARSVILSELEKMEKMKG